MERVLVGGCSTPRPRVLLNGSLLSRSEPSHLGTLLRPKSRAAVCATGIRNLGNTCFLSAVLQTFRRHLDTLVERFPCTSTRRTQSMTFLLHQTLHQLNVPQEKVLDPRPLLAPLRKKFASFRQQQDTQELFHHIMDLIEEETIVAEKDIGSDASLWDLPGTSAVPAKAKYEPAFSSSGDSEAEELTMSSCEFVERGIESLDSGRALFLRPSTLRSLYLPKEEHTHAGDSLEATVTPTEEDGSDATGSGLARSASLQRMNNFMRSSFADMLLASGVNRPSYSFDMNPFYGSLESQLRCKSCASQKLKFEKFLDLSLSIPQMSSSSIYERKSCSLQRCLEDFVSPEEVQARCSQCPSQLKYKGYRVGRAPVALCLNVNRLHYESEFRQAKIHDYVDFPMQLDLGPYQSKISGQPKALYRLQAVVEHHGGADGFTGHFTTYRRAEVASDLGLGIHRWVHINDEGVMDVQEEEVLKARAYMLFYERNQ